MCVCEGCCSLYPQFRNKTPHLFHSVSYFLKSKMSQRSISIHHYFYRCSNGSYMFLSILLITLAIPQTWCENIQMLPLDLWKKSGFNPSEISNLIGNCSGFHAHRLGWWENLNRKALYLMVKTMVSCRFSLKPIQWHAVFSCVKSLKLEPQNRVRRLMVALKISVVNGDLLLGFINMVISWPWLLFIVYVDIYIYILYILYIYIFTCIFTCVFTCVHHLI